MRLFYLCQKKLKATRPGHHLPPVKEVGMGVKIIGFHSIRSAATSKWRQEDFHSMKFLELQNGLVNEHLIYLLKNILKKIFENMDLEVFK